MATRGSSQPASMAAFAARLTSATVTLEPGSIALADRQIHRLAGEIIPSGVFLPDLVIGAYAGPEVPFHPLAFPLRHLGHILRDRPIVWRQPILRRLLNVASRQLRISLNGVRDLLTGFLTGVSRFSRTFRAAGGHQEAQTESVAHGDSGGKSNDEPSHARYQARRLVDKRVGEIEAPNNDAAKGIVMDEHNEDEVLDVTNK